MWLISLFLVGVARFVVVPRLGFWIGGAPAPKRALLLPWVSAVLFAVAWFLPNPALAHTSTFTQHAVGGGAACAVAGLFVALNVGIRSSILRIAFAYAVAASLGVGVELVELAYSQTYGGSLTADSSWALLANSIGAILVAFGLEIGARFAGLHAGIELPSHKFIPNPKTSAATKVQAFDRPEGIVFPGSARARITRSHR